MTPAIDQRALPVESVTGSPTARQEWGRGGVHAGAAAGVTRDGCEQRSNVPTPARVWWREFRVKVLPWVLFLGALGGVIALWCNLSSPMLVW